MQPTKAQSEDDIDSAFQSGSVFEKSDTVLFEYLKALNTGHIPNDMVRHRSMNRCITINTIITHRLAKKIDKGNTNLAIVVLVIALVDVAASVAQIVIR